MSTAYDWRRRRRKSKKSTPNYHLCYSLNSCNVDCLLDRPNHLKCYKLIPKILSRIATMKSFSYTYIKILITLVSFLGMIFGVNIYNIIDQTTAASIENDANSFIYYKQKITSALQDMEREFRVNNTITDSTISNMRSLIQEAYVRLPDSGDMGTKNE